MKIGRVDTLRLCGKRTDPPPCLQRDWYETCLACIAELEDHAAHHGNLSGAHATWCELCSAVGDGLDEYFGATADDDDADYLNAGLSRNGCSGV